MRVIDPYIYIQSFEKGYSRIPSLYIYRAIPFLNINAYKQAIDWRIERNKEKTWF